MVEASDKNNASSLKIKASISKGNLRDRSADNHLNYKRSESSNSSDIKSNSSECNSQCSCSSNENSLRHSNIGNIRKHMIT